MARTTPSYRSKTRVTDLAYAERLAKIDVAINYLKLARDQLKKAGTVLTAGKVRAALKSAEGARRHAELADIRGRRQERDRAAKLAARQQEAR